MLFQQLAVGPVCTWCSNKQIAGQETAQNADLQLKAYPSDAKYFLGTDCGKGKQRLQGSHKKRIGGWTSLNTVGPKLGTVRGPLYFYIRFTRLQFRSWAPLCGHHSSFTSTPTSLLRYFLPYPVHQHLLAYILHHTSQYCVSLLCPIHFSTLCSRNNVCHPSSCQAEQHFMKNIS